MIEKFGKTAVERFGEAFLSFVEDFDKSSTEEIDKIFFKYARMLLEKEVILCIKEYDQEYAKGIFLIVTTMFGEKMGEVDIEDVKMSFFKKELKNIFDDKERFSMLGKSLVEKLARLFVKFMD